MADLQQSLVSSAIFEHLQSKIDEDAKVREQIRDILQDLDKQGVCTVELQCLAVY